MTEDEIIATMIRFQHPFSAIVAGSSGTGKTVLTRSLLSDFKQTTNIRKDRLKVLWCHGQAQDLHQEAVPGIDITYANEFVYEFGDERPDVVVYDDLMSEIAGNKALTDVFTKKRHHEGVSVIFIVQNLFFQTKEMRTISLNCMYFILMKNPRDRLQVMNLGRQIFPHSMDYFMKTVDDAFRDPFSHLIVDMTSACDDSIRLRQRVKDGNRSGWYVWSR